MWKIVEKVVTNLILNTPITWKLSERRGRLCDVLSVVPGAVGTKCYHSFKWHAIRLARAPLESGIDKIFLEIIRSYVDKFDVFFIMLTILKCPPLLA